MQVNSGRQLAAPLCTSVSAEAFGTANAALTRFSNGHALLAAAVVAGATVATFDVTPGEGGASSATNAATSGFVNDETVIVGYGTDQQEEIVLGASAVTDHNTLTVAAGQKWKFSHSAGARIVRKSVLRAMRPGSVVLARAGGTSLTDNADGSFSGSDGGAVTGTIEYATGVAYLSYAAAPGASAITLSADLLADSPDIADLSGKGFHANMLVSLASRESAPTTIHVTNLGSSTVGVFVEISRNNGRSFSTKGYTRLSCELKGLATKVLTVPAGTGGLLDQVRIRAGQKPSSASTLDEDEARIVKDGVIMCDFTTIRNANAGGL